MTREERLKELERLICLQQSLAEGYEREIAESQRGADKCRARMSELYREKNQLLNLELNFNLEPK
jgi:uncharacterized coiled-coil protein SlyX